MPNYDELEHDRTFTIGGETFVIHDVAPEVITLWETEDESVPETGEEALKRLDVRVLAFLNGDPEQAKRWKALRSRKTNVVPMWKLGEMLRGMVETQTGRPTSTPSPSPSGPGRTGRTSGGE